MTVLIRPSWGMRRSAMLMSAMTLRRLTMPDWMFFGGRITSWSTPSPDQSITAGRGTCR